MNFKVNDFALLDGKLVQIKKIRLYDSKTYLGSSAIYYVQVKLHNSNLKHWIDSEQLEPLNCQKAPKILFSK